MSCPTLGDSRSIRFLSRAAISHLLQGTQYVHQAHKQNKTTEGQPVALTSGDIIKAVDDRRREAGNLRADVVRLKEDNLAGESAFNYRLDNIAQSIKDEQQRHRKAIATLESSRELLLEARSISPAELQGKQDEANKLVREANALLLHLKTTELAELLATLQPMPEIADAPPLQGVAE